MAGDFWLGFILLLNSERDVKTIGKHIANAPAEELKGFSTVAKFETVQIEGKRSAVRQVEYYDLDMILSVGYRVKSPQV